MGIFERAKNYKKKKKAGGQEVLASEQSSATEWAPEELSVTDIDTPSPQDKVVKVDPEIKEAPVNAGGLTGAAQKPDMKVQAVAPKWINAGSYEAAAKSDPSISRGQYAYELSKYRRSQGQPDLSYAEWSNIIKGQDPYETEAERQKRERNLRTANQINAIGTFLNALVNYNRVKNGHVGYTPDKGTEMYNRLERIRLGQEQLARSNAKDYLSAVTHDRAERAKQEAAAASAKQAERNYQLKVDELEWKMNNAKTEAERKKTADELAAAKFAWQKQKDEATMKETQRHNKASEATARVRAERTGSGSNSKKYLDLKTGSGSKRYSPEEHGSNWIHKAYQDMLKEAKAYAKEHFGDKTEERIDSEGNPYEVKLAEEYLNNIEVKKGYNMFGSSVPSEQEMYDAITKYNDSLWKDQYRSSRYGGGSKDEKPPLE